MTTPAKIIKAIQEEIRELKAVIQWSREHPELSTALTLLERNKVSLEIGHLERAANGQITCFSQQATVETKIIRITYLINRTGWVPKN